MVARFKDLFKKYRLKAGFGTLAEFGTALSYNGYIYENSIFSHWQKGTRVPNNRKMLLVVIKLFSENKAFLNLEEANEFLASTGLGSLTRDEITAFHYLLVENKTSEKAFTDSTDSKEKELRFADVARHAVRREITIFLFVSFTIFWFALQIIAAKNYNHLFSSSYFIVALFGALWGIGISKNKDY